MSYVYFVSFTHSNTSRQFGFGNAEMTLNEPVETIVDVREMERVLRDDHKVQRPVILAWHPLRSEP